MHLLDAKTYTYMVLVVSFHVLADSFVTCVRVIISVPPVFIQLISGFINSTHLKLFVCESALVCMSILPVIMELFFLYHPPKAVWMSQSQRNWNISIYVDTRNQTSAGHHLYNPYLLGAEYSIEVPRI